MVIEADSIVVSTGPPLHSPAHTYRLYLRVLIICKAVEKHIASPERSEMYDIVFIVAERRLDLPLLDIRTELHLRHLEHVTEVVHCHPSFGAVVVLNLNEQGYQSDKKTVCGNPSSTYRCV